MAYSKINIKAPDVNRTFVQGSFSYSKPETIRANTGMLIATSKKYSSLMDKWGEDFDIPNYVINSFICTESGGKNVGRNSFGAIGLMQATAETVYEVVTKWDVFVDVPLSTSFKAILSKNTPNWKAWDRNRKMTSSDTNSIEKALRNEEFNIALGCAIVRWMLEAFAQEGVAPLNKTMVAYNSGFYGARAKMRGLTTTEQLLNRKGLGKEPKAYLLKMLGVNGFLDLWYKEVRK
jgi:hypothetical protein